MSKKKNGKHISGDPRKNSKPMSYKGINKEKKPEILCSRIIYDSMVEKTSREIKNMGIMNEKKSILDRFEKVILLNSRCVLGHSSIVEVEGHYYGKN